MQKELDCMIGYSDHTIGNTIPIMAVSRGAVMIEKHFTLDKNLSGPDHKASLEPDELKRMVTKIRNVEKAKGIYKKKPTKSEEKIMKIVRKSIVFERDAEKGEIITKDMLIIKRPGTGLNPKDMEEMIGRKLKKDVKKDQILNFTMVE
jgi:sialic acid synthase SpsE